MNTEITDNGARPPAGWVFYDGECEFCVRSMRRWGSLFAERGFVWLPLQSPMAADRLGSSAVTMRDEMKLLLADGSVTGGIEAWAILFCSVWWLWPVGTLLDWPGIHWLGRTCYAWVARNRYCLGGRCQWHKPHSHPHRHSAFLDMP